MGQMSYFTGIGRSARCHLIKLTLHAPDIYTTGAQNLLLCVFGIPCVPSLGSKLRDLDIVYSFCLLGDLFIYYVKYYCIINSQCV